jgi:hypothetical protein
MRKEFSKKLSISTVLLCFSAIGTPGALAAISPNFGSSTATDLGGSSSTTDDLNRIKFNGAADVNEVGQTAGIAYVNKPATSPSPVELIDGYRGGGVGGPGYSSINDIGVLNDFSPGSASSSNPRYQAYSINDSGQVAGASFDSVNSRNDFFVTTPTGGLATAKSFRATIAALGVTSTTTSDGKGMLNNSGVYVGRVFLGSAGLLDTNGAPAIGGREVDVRWDSVNNTVQIVTPVGYNNPSNPGLLFNGRSSTVINDAGQIAGSYGYSQTSDPAHSSGFADTAYITDVNGQNGTFLDAGMPDGLHSGTRALGINDRGDLVGNHQSFGAWVWKPTVDHGVTGTGTALLSIDNNGDGTADNTLSVFNNQTGNNAIGTVASAMDINDSGIAVGYLGVNSGQGEKQGVFDPAVSAAGWDAFFWNTNGGNTMAVNLQTLLSPTDDALYDLGGATAINNEGDITVLYWLKTDLALVGNNHAQAPVHSLLLTHTGLGEAEVVLPPAVPEPTSLALLGFGGFVMLRRHRD